MHFVMQPVILPFLVCELPSSFIPPSLHLFDFCKKSFNEFLYICIFDSTTRNVSHHAGKGSKWSCYMYNTIIVVGCMLVYVFKELHTKTTTGM